VDQFVADLPATMDRASHPLPAEDQVLAAGSSPLTDLTVLLIGAQRLAELTGRAHAAFLGRNGGRGQFLDPSWVAHRRQEHAGQSLAVLGRALVDDMLAQSRRVMMRRLRLDTAGRMTMFTKLHERNGRYFAEHLEGSGNVGLRLDQLAALAQQVGVFDTTGATVTPAGRQALELPA
jgi:hypothetical protein